MLFSPPTTHATPLRRDLRLANLNAGIWAVGNGLVSTTLVIYLALELGAQGLAISGILAAPRFAGVLRLGLPSLLGRVGRRRAMCVAAYAASSATLLLVPLAGRAGGSGIAWLVVGWSVYHLLEYGGTVLLWSWLGDLMPAPLRGRLTGARERWLVVGRIIGLATSFGLATLWPLLAPDAARWVPLAWSACVGAALMLASTVPLLLMRPLQSRPSAAPRAAWRAIGHCLTDPPYRRLLTYSCFFALANGLTATAQNLYPQRVLGVGYREVLLLRGMMRSGQAALAGPAGRWIDARGARGMMFASQLAVATGPLFYFFASESSPWWIVGAWIAWVAYAGINVGLDHLKVALAPPDNNAPAIAAYHAISDLANGGMIVVGGIFFDQLGRNAADALPHYAAFFLAGWLARTLVAGLVLRIAEPARAAASATEPP